MVSMASSILEHELDGPAKRIGLTLVLPSSSSLSSSPGTSATGEIDTCGTVANRSGEGRRKVLVLMLIMGGGVGDGDGVRAGVDARGGGGVVSAALLGAGEELREATPMLEEGLGTGLGHGLGVN